MYKRDLVEQKIDKKKTLARQRSVLSKSGIVYHERRVDNAIAESSKHCFLGG